MSETMRGHGMRQELRRQLADPTRAALAPFVWDAGQARFAVDAGHSAVYMTGFGTASTYGLPDIGLIGLGEMAANAERIAGAVDVPLVADADTGYGNAVNVAYAVRRYEVAGVAALHIEDQVWPKRCGFMAGKEVIPVAEAAAVEARQDPDLVIIARSDALAPLGWDAVVERGHAFMDSGADLFFIDGLKTREDIERAAELLPDMPRLLNSGEMTAEEARALNYRLVIQLDTLRALFGRIRDVYAELAGTGRVAAVGAPSIDEIAGVLGLAEHRAVEQRFAVTDAG